MVSTQVSQTHIHEYSPLLLLRYPSNCTKFFHPWFEVWHWLEYVSFSTLLFSFDTIFFGLCVFHPTEFSTRNWSNRVSKSQPQNTSRAWESPVCRPRCLCIIEHSNVAKFRVLEAYPPNFPHRHRIKGGVHHKISLRCFFGGFLADRVFNILGFWS